MRACTTLLLPLPARSRKRRRVRGNDGGRRALDRQRVRRPPSNFRGASAAGLQRLDGLVDGADARTVEFFGLLRELLVSDHHLLARLALARGDAARALRLHPGLVDFGRDLLDVRQVHPSPPAPAACPARAPSRSPIAT